MKLSLYHKIILSIFSNIKKIHTLVVYRTSNMKWYSWICFKNLSPYFQHHSNNVIVPQSRSFALIT